MGRVVALEFHANRLRISVLRLVDDGVGLREFSRRGDIEKGILGGRRDSVDDVGNQAVYYC